MRRPSAHALTQVPDSECQGHPRRRSLQRRSLTAHGSRRANCDGGDPLVATSPDVACVVLVTGAGDVVFGHAPDGE